MKPFQRHVVSWPVRALSTGSTAYRTVWPSSLQIYLHFYCHCEAMHETLSPIPQLSRANIEAIPATCNCTKGERIAANRDANVIIRTTRNWEQDALHWARCIWLGRIEGAGLQNVTEKDYWSTGSLRVKAAGPFETPGTTRHNDTASHLRTQSREGGNHGSRKTSVLFIHNAYRIPDNRYI